MAAAVAEPQLDETGLKQTALTWPERASTVRVLDARTRDAACELLLGIKDLLKEADRIHNPAISAAYDSHKAALKAKGEVTAPLTQAETTLKQAIGRYDTEQTRLRFEEERRAREESQRLADELRESQIERAEAHGASAEEITEIIEAPMIMPRPALPARPVQQVAGVSTATSYEAHVFDLRALCRAIAEGRAPEIYVLPNQASLNGVARSQRGLMNVPGVRVVEKPVVRAGRR